jgi:hypothetical protein
VRKGACADAGGYEEDETLRLTCSSVTEWRIKGLSCSKAGSSRSSSCGKQKKKGGS